VKLKSTSARILNGHAPACRTGSFLPRGQFGTVTLPLSGRVSSHRSLVKNGSSWQRADKFDRRSQVESTERKRLYAIAHRDRHLRLPSGRTSKRASTVKRERSVLADWLARCRSGRFEAFVVRPSQNAYGDRLFKRSDTLQGTGTGMAIARSGAPKGPKIRIAGVATPEIHESCWPTQPCPAVSDADARHRLVRCSVAAEENCSLVVRVNSSTMTGLSAGLVNVVARCRSPVSGDLSCARVYLA
jgi:hypothetical protein